MLGLVGRIDIYRVDCVNVGAQKHPIDFRRCVNGNTIEGRDRGSCSWQWKTWGTHTAARPQACSLHDTKQNLGEEAPFHGPEVALRGALLEVKMVWQLPTVFKTLGILLLKLGG